VTRARLGQQVPVVVERARAQLRGILATVDQWRCDPTSRGAIA